MTGTPAAPESVGRLREFRTSAVWLFRYYTRFMRLALRTQFQKRGAQYL